VRTEIENIAETVNQWFDETFAQVQKNVTQIRELDMLLVGSLNCARKYCNAILIVLGNDHRMPAAALLRILCELHVKMLWCLQARDGMKEEGKDTIHHRFRRWDYQRVISHTKMLKNIGCGSSGDYKKEIDRVLERGDDQIAKYKSQGVRCMPDTAGLFKSLSGELGGDEVYPKIYQNFSAAVHIDMRLLRDMVQNSGNQIRCFADPPAYETNKLLLYCVSMGCDINGFIREHYGWDCANMRQELGMIDSQLAGTKKEEL